MTRTDGRRERGQASIELVGVVFVVVLVALLAVQGITVAQVASITQEAARNGARALSQGRGDWQAVVEHHVPDSLDLRASEAEADGGAVRVRVTVSAPLGLLGTRVADVAVTRSADFPMDRGVLDRTTGED